MSAVGPGSPTPNIPFATSYIIDRCPDDEIEPGLFCVSVEWRGRDRWGVFRRQGSKMCYDAEGNVDYEPQVSSREDEWLASHRFSLDDAIELAHRVLPDIKVGKMDYEEWVRVRTEMGDPPPTKWDD